jgi:hypothetical protein
MKHLKKINEWKDLEDAKLDDGNLAELEDVFLPIKDLDCENFKIRVDKFTPECYDITWSYPINLSLSSSSENINLESIKKHKDKISYFNRTQEATHEILEILIGMDYEISYYNVDEMDRDENGVDISMRFDIHIVRK